MNERFFVRAVGTELTEDSKLMSKEKAQARLRRIFNATIKNHDNGSWFDEMAFDEEAGEFQIYGEEFYQTGYLVPENIMTGPERISEEIRRAADENCDYAQMYEYELSDMGCFEISDKIRRLTHELDQEVAKLRANAAASLTREQRETIFREVEHEYLLEDAENALYALAGYIAYDGDSPSNKDAEAWFKKNYGYSLRAATNSKSKYYTLERAVVLFEKYESMDTCDEGTWECAIKDACHDMSLKVKEKA